MRKPVLKRIIATVIMVSCLACVAFSTSASEDENKASENEPRSSASMTFSFPANAVKGYSVNNFTPSKQKVRGKITSICFIGVPTETWVYGANVYTAVYLGYTEKSSWVIYTGKNQYKNATMNETPSAIYRLGGYTNASVGATNTQKWTEQTTS